MRVRARVGVGVRVGVRLEVSVRVGFRVRIRVGVRVRARVRPKARARARWWRASGCAAVVVGCCARQKLQAQRDAAGEQSGVPQPRLWLPHALQPSQAGSPHSPQRERERVLW